MLYVIEVSDNGSNVSVRSSDGTHQARRVQ
jgi:hypothetical protein